MSGKRSWSGEIRLFIWKRNESEFCFCWQFFSWAARSMLICQELKFFLLMAIQHINNAANLNYKEMPLGSLLDPIYDNPSEKVNNSDMNE